VIAADAQSLQQVQDVGPVVAQSVADFFAEKHNLEVINQLRNHGVPVAVYDGKKEKVYSNRLPLERG
jgi:DNA ligase (NAD+)